MTDRADKTASAVAAFQREYEAELQVVFDVLEQLGWPPGRLILSSGPISVDRDYEVIIKRGVDLLHDLAVFKVKTKIGGCALRYWCGWIVKPEDLPKPSASTIANAKLEESRWTRTEMASGWIEDERPIGYTIGFDPGALEGDRTVFQTREVVTYSPDSQTLMSWVDEWANLTPAQLAELAAKK